jgi:hypothetical protein
MSQRFLTDEEFLGSSASTTEEATTDRFMTDEEFLGGSEPEASTGNSYLGNIGRGMVEGATALGGEFIGSVGLGAGLAADAFGDDTTVGSALRGISKEGKSLRDRLVQADAGYNEGDALNTSFDEVLEAPVSNILPFIFEQGLLSIPDMAAMAANFPGYVVSQTGKMSYNRAANDNREEPTLKDILIAAPTAVAVSLLDRLGMNKMFGLDEVAVQGTKQWLKETGKAGLVEAGTEGVQTVTEGLGTGLGTEKGVDPYALGKEALGATVAGGGIGATIRGATGGLEATTGVGFGRDPAAPGAARVDPTVGMPPPGPQGASPERESVSPGQTTAEEPAAAQRPADETLTPEDEASPLKNDDISEGKKLIDDLMGETLGDTEIPGAEPEPEPDPVPSFLSGMSPEGQASFDKLSEVNRASAKSLGLAIDKIRADGNVARAEALQSKLNDILVSIMPEGSRKPPKPGQRGPAFSAKGPYLRAAVKMPDGKVVKGELGETHANFMNRMGIEEDAPAEYGFINNKARFLDRGSAMEYARDNDLLQPRFTRDSLKNSGLAGDFLKSYAERQAGSREPMFRLRPETQATLDDADTALSPAAQEAITKFVAHGPKSRGKTGFDASGIMNAEPLEKAARGEDKALAKEIETAFAPVRERLRKEFGDTIKLYRVQQPVEPRDPNVIYVGMPKDAKRAALSWTADPEFANAYADVRPDRPLYSEAEISAAEAEHAKTGKVKIGPYTLTGLNKYKDRNGNDRTSIDIMGSDGFVTDTDSVRSYMESANQRRSEFNEEQAGKKQKIVSADVSLDDVMWVTDRAAQEEFIVRNEPGRSAYIDETGKLQPKAEKRGPMASAKATQDEEIDDDEYDSEAVPVDPATEVPAAGGEFIVWENSPAFYKLYNGNELKKATRIKGRIFIGEEHTDATSAAQAALGMSDDEISAGVDDDTVEFGLYRPKADKRGPMFSARAKLTPAVRMDGKIYTGTSHVEAISKAPKDVQRRYGMDADNRGYVDARGRFRDRFKAQEYAVENDLIRKDAPSWARTAPELASEMLEKAEPEERGPMFQARTLREGTEKPETMGLPPEVPAIDKKTGQQKVDKKTGKPVTKPARYSTYQIAAALQARQRQKYGTIEPNDRSTAASNRIADWIADEVEFESLPERADKSGAGWYSYKFQAALDKFGQQFPELLSDAAFKGANLPGLQRLKNSKNARDLLTALIAVTSDGQKVAQNFAYAARAYESFRETGMVDTDVTYGADRNASIRLNLGNINDLMAKYGPEQMHKLLLEEQTVSELKKTAEDMDVNFSVSYQAHIRLPLAAVIFGPKLGAFYSNLMGSHGYLTMDRWWSRTFNRYRGQLLKLVSGTEDRPTDARGNPIGLNRFKHMIGEPTMSDEEALSIATQHSKAYADKNFKNGTDIEKAANTIRKDMEGINDMPFTSTDRTFMIETTERARKKLERRGLTISIADIQAVLWYFEKRLYAQLGAKETADESYEEVADRVASSGGRGLEPDADSSGRSDAPRDSRRKDAAAGGRGGEDRRQAASGPDGAAEQVSPLKDLYEIYPSSVGPNQKIYNAKQAYLRSIGMPVRRQAAYVRADPARGKRIADAFDAMEHNPSDPEVAAAYRAMIDETVAQYRFLEKELGLKIEFIQPGQPDPYHESPRLALQDLHENAHLWVFPTDSGFGSSDADISGNPLLEPTDIEVDGRQLLANDVFRIVHDVFGHGPEGAGFGPTGEENAWQSHVRMYSPLAARAMTVETRGQNSWVNFGPHGEANRKNQKETVFADQKIGILPEWVSQEGIEDARGPMAQTKTDTPAFKRWFGDSKVVDAKGQPLVVYHGTTSSFDTFRSNIRKGEQLGFGIHFAADESLARRYADDPDVARKGKAPTVMPVYLSVQNLLKADRLVREGEPDFALAKKLAGGRLFTQKDESGIPAAWLQNAIDAASPEKAQRLIQEAGYDGVEYVARVGALAPGGRGMSVSEQGRSFIVFEPTQIKSVNNSGAFDPEDPRINAKLREPVVDRKTGAFDVQLGDDDVHATLRLTPKFAAKAAAVRKDLRAQLDKLGLTQFGVAVAEKITMTVNGQTHASDGVQFRKLIAVALDAENKFRTMNHEALHALRELNLFTPAEWAILSRRSNSEWRDRFRVKEFYGDRSEATQVEEGIAEAFAEWMDGAKVDGILAKSFRKIRSALQSLYRALTGNDLRTAEDIFAEAASGKIGRRAGTEGFRREPVAQAAWHGTPHDFDAFSLAHMGSGEGAQAFGWGLYFAGKKAIAEYYRDKLARDVEFNYGGVKYRDRKGDHTIPTDVGGNLPYEIGAQVMKAVPAPEEPVFYDTNLNALERAAQRAIYNIVDRSSEDLVSAFDDEVTRHEARIGWQDDIDGAPTADDLIKAYRSELQKVEVKSGGKLYQVEIPEDSEMLDWDVPLYEQPQEVQDKIKAMNLSEYALGIRGIAEGLPGRAKGSRGNFSAIYERLARELAGSGNLTAADMNKRGDQLASEALRAAGIPGHRFLDSTSRDDDGYVVQYRDFSDKGPDLPKSGTFRTEEEARDFVAEVLGYDLDAPNADKYWRISKKPKSFNYVIYDDARIKVEAKFRLRGFGGLPPVSSVTQPLAARMMTSIKRNKNVDNEGLIEYAHRRVVDYLQPLKKLIDSADAPIADAMNAYQQARLALDATVARILDMHGTYVDPMIDALSAAGATLEELHQYAYARHVPERNRVVGLRNEPGSDFYKAVTDHDKVGASGWSTNQAKQVMRDFQQMSVNDPAKWAGIKEAYRNLRDMLDDSLWKQHQDGLISTDQLNTLRAQWKHYVPMMGEEAMDESGDFASPGRGTGFDVRGKEFKGATGRFTEAENIPAWAISLAERGHLRAEKNKVGVALLRFLSNTQTHIADVYWTKGSGFGNLSKAQPVYKRELDKNGKVVNRKVPPHLISPEMFAVKVNGNNIYLNFDDPKIGMALKNMNAVDISFLSALSRKLTSFQSFINTRGNPAFIPTNFFRDATTAYVHLLDEGFNAKEAGAVLAGIPSAWAAVWRDARGRPGSTPADSAMAEWKKAGGKLIFSPHKSIEDTIADLHKRMADRTATGMRPLAKARSLLKILEDLNDTIENGVRLSAYMAMRAKGRTVPEASLASRDLTVDFRKHGEIGPHMNSWYTFFNASVQGNFNVAKRLATSKKVRRAAYAIALSGFMMDMINRAISGDDDDGENEYAKMLRTEPWKFERQMVIFYGPGEGSYFTIPMPYGYNALYHMGLQASAATHGDVSVFEAVARTAHVAMDAFNPMGGSNLTTPAGILSSFAPTVADPIIEIASNENFAGAPIAPTQYPGDYTPDSQRSFSSTGDWAKTTAEWLNSAFGGTYAESAAFGDVSPDTIEHVGSFVTGGLGRFFAQSADAGGKIATGRFDEIEPENVPFVRSFFGRRDNDNAKTEYYQIREDVARVKAAMKDYKDARDKENQNDLRARHPVEVKAIVAFDEAEKDLRKIRKLKRAAERDGKADKVKNLEEREINRMNRARRTYARLRKEHADGT